MISLLKSHPFAVEAYFENSFILTFAVPKEQVENLIPDCLQLDLLNNKWAFVAVAMVQTKGLKPKGFPKFMGRDFFLIGYRIFVRYVSTSGKRLRGLYILKSETDRREMEFMGNIFTHYSYTTTDIDQREADGKYIFNSGKSDFKVEMEVGDGDVPLPEKSPFIDWKDARRYAGPLPFTFSYNSAAKEVLIIEGVRHQWLPRPVKVSVCNFSFLNSLNFQGSLLASAFVVSKVPYYWKKGRIEKWKG